MCRRKPWKNGLPCTDLFMRHIQQLFVGDSSNVWSVWSENWWLSGSEICLVAIPYRFPPFPHRFHLLCPQFLWVFPIRVCSSSLLHAIITCNHLPFLKIFLNFVHFCPNFQIFSPFLTIFSLLHLMHAIASTHTSTRATSLMRVKSSTPHFWHFNKENEGKVKSIKLNS